MPLVQEELGLVKSVLAMIKNAELANGPDTDIPEAQVLTVLEKAVKTATQVRGQRGVQGSVGPHARERPREGVACARPHAQQAASRDRGVLSTGVHVHGGRGCAASGAA